MPAASFGQLIEPTDITSFPLAKSASPSGNEYIGKIEVMDVTAGTNLQFTTFGGVQKTLVVAVGEVIEGPIVTLDALTNVTRVRVHYLNKA